MAGRRCNITLYHKGAVFVNLLAPLFLFILPRIRMYIFFRPILRKVMIVQENKKYATFTD